MTEGAQIQKIQVRYDIKAGGTMGVGLWGQVATRGVVVGTKLYIKIGKAESLWASQLLNELN
jgi:hypothetical protein